MINKPNHRSLSLILGFSITITIWLREVVSCRDFILRSVATFWVVSLVGIYPGRASNKVTTNYPHIALPEPNILILSRAALNFLYIYDNRRSLNVFPGYSQLSPCGHPAITDTPIIRTAAKSPAKINYRRLTKINSRYYGLSLMRTLTRGPHSVRNKGSWLYQTFCCMCKNRLALAWENSQHFAMLWLLSPQNASEEFPTVNSQTVNNMADILKFSKVCTSWKKYKLFL